MIWRRSKAFRSSQVNPDLEVLCKRFSEAPPAEWFSLEIDMKNVVLVLLIAFAVTAFTKTFPSNACAATGPELRKSLIVSTEWLAQHLNDNSLVLLQVGEKNEYVAGHIPGAQFINVADISTSQRTFRFQLWSTTKTNSKLPQPYVLSSKPLL
jgi:hypothetical protein